MSDREPGGRHGRDYRPGERASADLQDMATQAMELWSDVGRMWFGYLAPFTPGAWRGGRQRDRESERGEGSPPRGERLAVSVELSSTQPAEVTLDLRHDGSAEHLKAQDLCPIDRAAGPPLQTISFDEVNGRLRVRIAVPNDQPPGVYVGAIVDRKKDEVRGTLKVTVLAK
jgi:hypothetical protein